MGFAFWLKLAAFCVAVAIVAVITLLVVSKAFVAWGVFGGFLALAVVLVVTAPLPLLAQSEGEGTPLAAPYDGPPPPVAPAVVTRDELGNATIRAVRVTTPIEVDGRLDEAFYREVPAISDFVQILPEEGARPSERTEAWIAFDDENIYVGGRVWDSHPESEWVANEMRRDANALTQNDNFGVAFDTFHDRRNGVFFYVNPLGARSDVQHTNEGNPNRDWNPIWDARTGRFEGGWTVEMQIPFKSLRYRPGRDQIWGVQLRRAIRRKNEWTYLTHIPRSTVSGGSGAGAVMRISRHATLVGIEAPGAGRVFEVKPWLPALVAIVVLVPMAFVGAIALSHNNACFGSESYPVPDQWTLWGRECGR